MSHTERLTAVFDRLADDGTAERSELLLDDVVRQALDAMEVRPGHQLLDVGCGAGWTTRRLGKKAPGAQAVGIDVAPGMIAKADGLSDWTSRARFECAAIESFDAPDARFDHVLALDVLEFVEDPGRSLASIARVTKPGGRLELLVHRHAGSPSSEGWAELYDLPMHWLADSDWAAHVAGAGFAVDATDVLRDARDAAPFEPSLVAPDEATHDALRAAGVLRIRATRSGE
ncbi:MAG: class I SAM-dependent methyltransferase [Planctomycetota bacterium]